jgi:hypothetical protein
MASDHVSRRVGVLAAASDDVRRDELTAARVAHCGGAPDTIRAAWDAARPHWRALQAGQGHGPAAFGTRRAELAAEAGVDVAELEADAPRVAAVLIVAAAQRAVA